MSNKPFYISETDFRVWLPDVVFKSEGDDQQFDSRKIEGIMSTQRRDRQGEVVAAKGLDFSEFLHGGHFNDNHSQETSAIVGYPQAVQFHADLGSIDPKLKGVDGWSCKGYVLKGTKRAEGIWELAQALQAVPNRKLGFSIEGKVTRRVNKTIESAKIRNVAITNCFTGDTKVVGAANKVTKRFYSGDMVEIELATGEKISATPNHPIFTQRGWVAIGELDEVNDRIGRFDSDLAKSASLSQVAHDVNNVPSTFEQIFNASLVSGDCLRVGQTGKRDFHGDGATGDVDVVITDSKLRNALHTSFFQKFGKKALVCADKKHSLLFGFSLKLKLVVARLVSLSGPIGSFGKLAPLVNASFSVPNSVGFDNASNDSISLGNLPHGLPSDSVFGGDKGRVLSKSVGFANIKFKRVFEFFGHVYNLDTTHGWYEVNGIVAHNCPVNTDCNWNLLAKSFSEEEVAMKSLSHDTEKAMSAGYGASPGTQTGGGAIRGESLEKDPADVGSQADKKKKREATLKAIIGFDDMIKAMDWVLESRPNFDEEAAATFIHHLFKKGGKL